MSAQGSDCKPRHVDEKKFAEIHLCTTPDLLKVFDQYLPRHDFQVSFPSAILADEKLCKLDLKSLLKGSAIVHATKPAAQVNVAHEERMIRLRQELEEQSYQSMISQDPQSSLAETRDELRALKNQLSTIINVGISIFTAAMAAWFWTPHWSSGSRVLGSLAAAIGLGAIETFLYLRYLAKIEEGKQYEAKKKDKSSIKRSSSKNDKAALKAE